MPSMHVLSLWQPWASLMAMGLKLVETRDWPMPPNITQLAIHAAKKPFKPNEYEDEFIQQLYSDGVPFLHLPIGAVLCFGDVVRRAPTERVRDSLSPRELMYGNYDDGRHTTTLDNIRVLPEPFPLKGQQGIFRWDMPQDLYESCW